MQINLVVLIISLLLAYLLFFLVTKSMKLVGKIVLILIIAYLIYPYLTAIFG